MSLRRVSLRQDEAFGSVAGHTIDLEVKLAHTTFDPATITATFASNLNSGSATTVFPRANLALPAMPAANNNPGEFFCEIPFSTPFPFNPSRNLLIDVTQRGNDNGNASFTYPLDAASGVTTTRVFGLDTATTGSVGRNYGLVMCFEGPEQCVIVPLVAREAMGNSNNNIPFSWTPTRYQQVFLASEIGPWAMSLQAMGLRQTNAFFGQTGGTVDVEIVLGSTSLTETTMTTTFANNITGSATCVVPRQNIVLPNMPGSVNTDPKQFVVNIPFARPFNYGGSQNLVVDITQRGNSRGGIFTYPLDASSGAGVGTTRVFGFPDTATTGTLGVNYGLVMCFNNTASGGVPGTYDYFGAGCAGNGPGTINTVLPSSFAATLGNSNNRFPFGAGTMRYQQVFLGSEAPSARSFNALELRQASGQTGYTGYGVDLQIDLGYTTLNNASLTSTYAANFNSGAPVTVLPAQRVVLPNFPTTAASASNWFLRIPFAAPFNYVPAAGRNLLVQITNRGDDNGDFGFDYYLDATSGGNTTRLFNSDPTAATGTLGVNYGLIMNFASAGATGATPQLLAVGDPVIGNTLAVNVWQARANSVGILFLGFSNTSWLSIPLPLPLAGAGAPGCSLLVAGDVILSTPTNSVGFGSFTLPVPGDPSLVGGQFFNQYAIFDPGINALSLSWSNGGRGTIGNN